MCVMNKSSVCDSHSNGLCLKTNPEAQSRHRNAVMDIEPACPEGDTYCTCGHALTCRARGTPAAARAPGATAPAWPSGAGCAADPCRTTDPRSAGCTCSGGCHSNLLATQTSRLERGRDHMTTVRMNKALHPPQHHLPRSDINKPPFNTEMNTYLPILPNNYDFFCRKAEKCSCDTDNAVIVTPYHLIGQTLSGSSDILGFISHISVMKARFIQSQRCWVWHTWSFIKHNHRCICADVWITAVFEGMMSVMESLHPS